MKIVLKDLDQYIKVFNSTGDGFLLALSHEADLSEIINAAFNLQDRLHRPFNIRVRQAIGAGACVILKDYTGKDDIVGTVVNEVARICSVGDGGHLLLPRRLKDTYPHTFEEGLRYKEYKDIKLKHIGSRDILSVFKIHRNPAVPEYILKASTKVFKQQNESLADLRSFLAHSSSPKEIKFIEYSGQSIKDLVLELDKKECRGTVLLRNPDCAYNEDQEKRIRTTLDELEVNDLKNIEIRFYSLPASIRGRVLDDKFISVGWYTYNIKKNGIWGHINCMINAYTSTEEGRHLLEMFNRAFNDLLKDSITSDQLHGRRGKSKALKHHHYSNIRGGGRTSASR